GGATGTGGGARRGVAGEQGPGEGRREAPGEEAASAEAAAKAARPVGRVRLGHEAGRGLRLQPAGRRGGEARGAAGQKEGRPLLANREGADARAAGRGDLAGPTPEEPERSVLPC